MYDSRLVGVWRSDAKRTGRELAARRDIPARNKRGLRRLFWKACASLYAHTMLRNPEWTQESTVYRVVAKNSSSVAIVSYEPMLNAEVISHLHFDGSHMWMTVGTGLFREFFMRVRPSGRIRLKARSRWTKCV
jgi:hypothetical protein